MTALVLLDAAGRHRSPATLPGYHCGRAPHNKGRRYPADPPPVEENIAVMRLAGETAHGLRTQALRSSLERLKRRQAPLDGRRRGAASHLRSADRGPCRFGVSAWACPVCRRAGRRSPPRHVTRMEASSPKMGPV
jgi:hypothetical protein